MSVYQIVDVVILPQNTVGDGFFFCHRAHKKYAQNNTQTKLKQSFLEKVQFKTNKPILKTNSSSLNIKKKKEKVSWKIPNYSNPVVESRQFCQSPRANPFFFFYICTTDTEEEVRLKSLAPPMSGVAIESGSCRKSI